MQSRAVQTALALALFFSSTAAAEEAAPPSRPHGSYVRIAPRPPRAEPAAFSRTIFFNRCAGGCTYTPGYEDSRTNRSEILGGTVHFSQFAYGDASWNQVMNCLREEFAPFGVVVTDVDPGNAEHYEAVVAGYSSEAGAGDQVLGVAPFTCGVIDNGISYTFANSHGNSPRFICETAAQESAHVFGLEHEYLCEDPMTYLYDCGNKSFQNIDAPCGEYRARACECGGSSQNSVEMLSDLFGPSTPTPPSIEITDPADGEQVDNGFIVRVDASDSNGMDRVELWLNGQLTATGTFPPYVFNAPTSLSDGVIQLEVRGYDAFGSMANQRISVVLGDPCGSPSDCADDETCVDGRCVAGPGTGGGLGDDCESGSDCASGLCPGDSQGHKYCTEVCDPDGSGCPDGFGCVTAGNGTSICWPGADDGGGGGGGCEVGATAHGWPLLGLGLLASLCALGVGAGAGGARRRLRRR